MQSVEPHILDPKSGALQGEDHASDAPIRCVKLGLDVGAAAGPGSDEGVELFAAPGPEIESSSPDRDFATAIGDPQGSGQHRRSRRAGSERMAERCSKEQ
jgi:hypothetical protein